MTEAEKKAREAAERVMSELHWGATAMQLMPQDIAASVRDDITAAILTGRREAIEECAKVAEDLVVTFARRDGTRAERMREAIAAAIRALAKEEPPNED